KRRDVRCFHTGSLFDRILSRRLRLGAWRRSGLRRREGRRRNRRRVFRAEVIQSTSTRDQREKDNSDGGRPARLRRCAPLRRGVRGGGVHAANGKLGIGVDRFGGHGDALEERILESTGHEEFRERGQRKRTPGPVWPGPSRALTSVDGRHYSSSSNSVRDAGSCL